MPERKVLQITLRLRDPKMIRFVEDKIRHMQRKGAKNANLQSVMEGLVAKWMDEDERIN